MIAYAAETSTSRNVAALRAAGWRLMLSAKNRMRHQGFRYALDNGAWHAYVKGIEFDEVAFLRALDLHGENADWIVVPDIVAGGLPSLEYSIGWTDRLAGLPLMLAVQDGMTVDDVEPYLDRFVGIFVGGSTEWKLATMATWGALARKHRKLLHVGRVNTVRRIYLCHAAGATSFDGSSVSRFAVNIRRLDLAARAPDFFGGGL